jgi:hypothetical protein
MPTRILQTEGVMVAGARNHLDLLLTVVDAPFGRRVRDLSPRHVR